MSTSLPDWLQPLEYVVQPFPRAAVEEAIARREQAIPHLLDAIDFALQNPDAKNEAGELYMLHIFAVYLLAQFRDTGAFPGIDRLARSADVEDLLDDVMTETLHQILAATCGSDLTPIQALIEDPSVNEWVRGAAVAALGVLLQEGMQSRETISAYIGRLFRGGLERKPMNAWDRMVCLCADFGMAEHLNVIRAAYEDVTDSYYQSLESVEKRLKNLSPNRADIITERYCFITDTVAELRGWACFRPEPAKRAEPRHFVPAGRPADLSKPNIGRNDPCPCLSGKKYKKCCGAG